MRTNRSPVKLRSRTRSGKQHGAANGLADPEAVEALWTDEALSVPAEVPLDLHGPRIVQGTCEARSPRSSSRRAASQVGLAALDASSGRLPQDLPIAWVLPAEKEDPVSPVKADDPRGTPAADAIHAAKVGGKPWSPGHSRESAATEVAPLPRRAADRCPDGRVGSVAGDAVELRCGPERVRRRGASPERRDRSCAAWRPGRQHPSSRGDTTYPARGRRRLRTRRPFRQGA